MKVHFLNFKPYRVKTPFTKFTKSNFEHVFEYRPLASLNKFVAPGIRKKLSSDTGLWTNTKGALKINSRQI